MERMCNKWWKGTKTLLNQRPTYALQSSYNNILKKLKWSWFKHHKKLTQLAINNTITKHFKLDILKINKILIQTKGKIKNIKGKRQKQTYVKKIYNKFNSSLNWQMAFDQCKDTC